MKFLDMMLKEPHRILYGDYGMSWNKVSPP